jgi:hypothetical protein
VSGEDRIAALEERVAALEEFIQAWLLIEDARHRARERANGTHLRLVDQ